MATIVARDDCAGESTGIRFVPCRDIAKLLDWILTEFGADQLMQMLKVCGQKFFRTHNHQSGIFDLTQNVICGFFWDISLCNYSFVDYRGSLIQFFISP